jgi:signal peptidase I
MNHELKTGDIILCDDLEYKDWGLLSWFIKFMTKSDFSHVGMIVKDPDFTDPPMKGTYLWMSGTSNVPDAEDNTKKFGVQFVPFDEYVNTYGGKLYIRKLHSERYYELFTTERLKKIHQVVYDKPYDIVLTDWIEAYCKKDPHPQKTSRFVCSAFIGYVYTQLTLLREDTDWSILYPGYFSSENPALRLRHESYLSPEELIHV